MSRKRDLRTARANTRLRYRPEERALAVLVGQAREELKTDRRVASGLAATAVRSARKARAPLARAYRQAQSAADTAHQDVEAAFGRTGSGADAFKAVTDREFALAQTRRADAARAEHSGLVAQENEARLGKLFAFGAAKQRYNSTLSQLSSQAAALRGEKRDYLVSQLGALASERAKLRESRAGRRYNRATQLMVAGRDPKTGKKLKGEGGGGGGEFDTASRSERRMFKTDYARALDVARQYHQQGAGRKQLAANLRSGVPAETIKLQPGQKDPRTGKKVKLPTSYRTPTIAPIDDELALRAALDVVYGGYVDQSTVKLLHQAGLRVDELPDAMTQGTLRRRRRRPVGPTGKAPF